MRIALLLALKGEDMERNNEKEIATLDSLTPKFGQSSRASTGNTRKSKFCKKGSLNGEITTD